MKHFTTILIVFLLFITIGKAKQEFMLYHLNYDFNGSCFFNNKIIVFGNSGDFVISDDMGKNWYREHIFVDTVSIVNLIPDGDYLIGSTKDGIFFTLDKNFKLKNMNLYYRGKEITSFTRLNDSIFAATTNDYWLIFIKSDLKEFKRISIQVYQGTSIFKVVKGNLFDYIGVCNNRIFFENYNSQNTVTLKISDFNIGNQIYNLYSFNNEIYLDIDGKLFKTNEKTFTLEKITKDSIGGINLYNNDFIYNIKRNDDSRFNFGTIGFYQLIDSTFERRCILNYDRLIYKDFEIKGVNLIDKKTIVAVGTHNTIFISYDGGFTWNIMSYFRPDYTVKWLNDKIGFFSSFTNQLFRTTDGGVTFLPQKRYDSIPYTGEFSYLLFDINENGQLYRWSPNYSKNVDDSIIYNFMLSNNFGEDYTYKWIDGILPKHAVDLYHPGGFNLVKFKNYNIHNLISGTSKFYTDLIMIEPSSLFNGLNAISVFHIDSIQTFLITSTEDKIWACFVKNDSAWLASSSDLELLNWQKVFSFNDYTINHKVAGMAMIAQFKALTYNTFSSPFIISVIDSSNNIDPSIDPYSGNIINGDFKYYEIRSHFYIDLNNDTYKLIYRDTLDVEGTASGKLKNIKIDYKPGFLKKSYLLPFLVDNDKVYFRKMGTFFEKFDEAYSCDVSNINHQSWVTILEKIELANFDKYNSSSILQSDFASFQKLTENKYVSDFAILEKGETINKVPEVERKESYLYKYLAYPQPGTNEIRVKIYTNNFDCFNPENFEIYNSEGVVNKSKDEFTMQQTGIYEAEIIWDCSKYSPGVYFIKLNCDTNQDAIKVIKN